MFCYARYLYILLHRLTLHYVKTQRNVLQILTFAKNVTESKKSLKVILTRSRIFKMRLTLLKNVYLTGLIFLRIVLTKGIVKKRKKIINVRLVLTFLNYLR